MKMLTSKVKILACCLSSFMLFNCYSCNTNNSNSHSVPVPIQISGSNITTVNAVTGQDNTYKIDSVIQRLASFTRQKDSGARSFIELVDTSIVFPQPIVSKERHKLNSVIYDDLYDWYIDEPTEYGLILSNRNFGKLTSLDGDDERSIIINADFSLPFRNIPPTRLFEDDSIIEVSNLQFNKEANFSGNSLKDRIRFFECDFKGLFSIQPLKANPIFQDCIFYNGFKITTWWNANDDAISPSYREKHKTRLRKDLIFNSCVLKGTFDISNISFDSASTLIMENTFLPDTLNLSKLDVQQPINLLTTIQNQEGKKCQLLLDSFNINKIDLLYTNFHLYIPPALDKDPLKRDRISYTYLQLLDKFKNNGFAESYKQLDIEYHQWLSKRDWTLVLSNIWWKFGYQKWRIIIISFAFILVFSIINFQLYNKLQAVYPVEKLQWNFFSVPGRFLHFFRKFSMALLYTCLIFFQFGTDYKNVTFTPMRYVALLIVEYVTGLVCVGFLINWILK